MGSSWKTLLFAVWGGALSVICAYFLGSHLLTLPVPSHDDPVLAAQLESRRTPADQGRWQVLHVLYGECKCSRQVAEHILDRGSLADDVVERVLFVGDDPEMTAAFQARGYAVETTTPDALNADWNVPAAPVMVVADPFGGLQYVGGYTDRKQGPDVRDLAILSSVRDQVSVPALPLFGCAVSRELAAAVDPLGIR